MPIKAMTREALVGSGLVPEHLANVYIHRKRHGSRLAGARVAGAADALWQAAYAELTAGV